MAGKTHRDHSGRPVVAVTGLGVVTANGVGIKDNWDGLVAGKSTIKKVTRFATDHLRTSIAGTVDFLIDGEFESPVLSHAMAELAADEAITMSGIGAPGDFPGPLYMAVPPVEMEWQMRLDLWQATTSNAGTVYDRMIQTALNGDYKERYRQVLFLNVAERISDRFGTRGMPISLTTACASGASAIQLGVEAIRRGDTAAALCMSTDGSITAEGMVRFSLLSALSSANESPTEASKPFSKNRDGFVMAEGAGALVLEDYDAAVARGAEILAVIRGVGEKADDFHRTRSKPDGSAIIGAIRGAVEDAKVTPDQIGYINAHGTSTPENDKMEAMSLEAVLGEALKTIPISSNKSVIGHTVTAAGAIEAVFSVLTMREGVLPPTINYKLPDPTIELDVVPNAARTQQVDMVMSNSFGFGGQNVTLLFSAEPA